MKATKLLLGLLAVLLLTGACRRNFFDEEQYNRMLVYIFPVDSIDPSHDWQLAKKGAATVSASMDGLHAIQVLTSNPLTTSTAEILDEAPMNGPGTVNMTYYMQKVQQSLVVAAVDENNNYLAVGQMATDGATVNLDESRLSQPTKASQVPTNQSVFYCFEENYPDPGDWDYNDLVLRLTKEHDAADPCLVRLEVSLEALGTANQLAAAIRLVGIGYDELDDVSTVGGYTFVGRPEMARKLIEPSDLLLKSRDGEAVLNLFDDGHLAFSKRLDRTGKPYRYYYNTGRSGDDGSEWSRIVVTYLLHFKTAERARSFSLGDLDPFAISSVNLLSYEIHTYQYKFAQVLSDYYHGNESAYDNGYCWAIEVPYSWFRYPRESNVIGQLKNSIVLGAYRTIGHSFAEWLLNHETSEDWYLYPAAGETH